MCEVFKLALYEEIFNLENQKLNTIEGDVLRYQIACKIFSEKLNLDANSNYYTYINDRLCPNLYKMIKNSTLPVEKILQIKPILLTKCYTDLKNSHFKNNVSIASYLRAAFLKKIALEYEKPIKLLNTVIHVNELGTTPLFHSVYEQNQLNDYSCFGQIRPDKKQNMIHVIPGKISKPFFSRIDKHNNIHLFCWYLIILFNQFWKHFTNHF